MLSPGTRLGAYEVASPLGAGGMGEVYRARDTKLGREVAVKILPGEFSSDQERLARFEREARVLASINDPHIAHIYGLERQERREGPLSFIVMELVEGEDLAARIARGPVPLDEALPIARQIAQALDAAHEQGIIHRDLKPANIKVRPDGTVKVLDFGLAKAVERSNQAGRAGQAGGAGGLGVTNSPTLTSPLAMTGVGVILGTAAYMAPEQARGKAVDRRADLWAFGCVLYEMLTGRRPFDGEDITAVLAKIIEREPDFGALPQATPASVRRLIRRCLEKNPSRRLASAHDALLEIDDAQTGAESAGAAVPAPAAVRPTRTTLPWLVTAVMGVGLAATALGLWRGSRAAPLRVMRYDIQLPAKTSLALAQFPPLAISRDGSMVAFVGASEGGTRLYLKRRDEPEVRALAGTERAADPLFSPDGRWLMFSAGRDLEKMMIGSGPTPVAPIQDDRGAAWLDDGSIVYSPNAGGGLMRLPAGGGQPQALTTLDVQHDERSHRWPVALPGGKAVLFIVGVNASPDDYNNSDVDAVIVATGERRKVMTGASFVKYVPTGHLVFMRNGAINAVRFDPDRLTVSGTPAPIVEGVAGDVTTGAAAFGAADDGTLVYAVGGAGVNGNRRVLVWADRSGAAEPIDLPPAFYNDQRISPDGSRFAVIVGASGSGDVWIFDVVRKTFTRLTFDRNAATPVWSADGRNVLYAAVAPNNHTSFYSKPVDGSRERERVGAVDGRSFLQLVNRAGDALMFVTMGGLNRVGDIIAMSVPDGRQTPIIATGADEFSGAASPDGRWLAYQSNESGRYEVYVTDRTGAGGRWQISTAGGEEPHWSADGSEIFYRVDDRLMHVVVLSREPFRAGTPQKLFDGIYNVRSDTGVSYDVDPKTGRFLMTRLADAAAAAPASSLKIVLNWFEDLRRVLAQNP